MHHWYSNELSADGKNIIYIKLTNPIIWLIGSWLSPLLCEEYLIICLWVCKLDDSLKTRMKWLKILFRTDISWSDRLNCLVWKKKCTILGGIWYITLVYVLEFVRPLGIKVEFSDCLANFCSKASSYLRLFDKHDGHMNYFHSHNQWFLR